MSKETMDHKPAPGFANGERHGWIDTLCGRLERVAHGRAAQALLDAGVEPGRRAIVTLPMWAWVPAGSTVGRKAKSADGGSLLLPLRVRWSSDALAVEVPAVETSTFTWTAIGRGRTLRGQLETRPGAVPSTRAAADLPPERLVVRSAGARPRKAALQRLVEDGEAAWWQIVFSLEGWVDTELKRANSKVSEEIAESGTASTVVPSANGQVVALSEQSLETLATTMLFGDEARSGSVPRLIDKCLDESFAKVDPLHFVRVWLCRDAEEVVRVGMGDLKFGGKVRRLLAASGAASPEEFMGIYRERYPYDRLGIKRLERALLVSVDPMASVASVDHPSWDGDGWESGDNAITELTTLDLDQETETTGDVHQVPDDVACLVHELVLEADAA